jgi:hypothetical protein
MEQTVHFGDTPNTYAGYYISTSSSSIETTPFASTQIRDDYEQALKAYKAEDWRLPALLAAAWGGNTEGDRDHGQDLLAEILATESPEFHAQDADMETILQELFDVWMNKSLEEACESK